MANQTNKLLLPPTECCSSRLPLLLHKTCNHIQRHDIVIIIVGHQHYHHHQHHHHHHQENQWKPTAPPTVPAAVSIDAPGPLETNILNSICVHCELIWGKVNHFVWHVWGQHTMTKMLGYANWWKVKRAMIIHMKTHRWWSQVLNCLVVVVVVVVVVGCQRKTQHTITNTKHIEYVWASDDFLQGQSPLKAPTVPAFYLCTTLSSIITFIVTIIVAIIVTTITITMSIPLPHFVILFLQYFCFCFVFAQVKV